MKNVTLLFLVGMLFAASYAQEAHTECNLHGPVYTRFLSMTDPVVDGNTSVVFRVYAQEVFLLKRSSLILSSGYTKPVTVVYERTPYSDTLGQVLDALHQWGVEHRKKNMG